MYTSTVNNAKVQSLPSPLFKAWVNLLCLAKDNEGAIPPIEEVAFQLRCTEVQARRWIRDLADRRLFDQLEAGVKDSPLVPHDWERHQYVSDLSTGRVRRYRESKAKRLDVVSETEDEATRKPPGNVSVTPSETEQRQSRAETESEIAAAAAVSETPPPPLHAWPIAAEHIARRFPTVDAPMVERIACAARLVDPHITDEKLAQVIDFAWKPKQTSPGLFVKTVPALLRNEAAANRAAIEQNRLATEQQTAKLFELFSRSDAETRADLKKSYPEYSGKWPEN